MSRVSGKFMAGSWRPLLLPLGRCYNGRLITQPSIYIKH